MEVLILEISSITTQISSCAQTYLKIMNNENIKIKQVGNLVAPRKGFDNPQEGRVYSVDGISPYVTKIGGQKEIKIAEDCDESIQIPANTKTGFYTLKPNGVYDAKYPSSKNRRGRVQGDGGDISPALTTDTDLRLYKGLNYRVRKLTPRECFRLMGVSEPDIDKIMSSGIADTNLYALAGNSIIVDTLFHIFRKLFIETENESQQLSLF